MDLWQALILGIIEGITEFLPVSSTGHLVLASKLLSIQQTEFVKSFEITIQLGAILAVLILYAGILWKNMEVVKRVIVAFLPTAIIGLALYKIVKQYLLGNDLVVIIALALGGLFIIIFELLHREKASAVGELEKMSYKTAFSIGVFQSLAIVPGVSRSAATILGGLLVGLKRSSIAEFSFLLAIPTMAAATGLDLFKNYQSFSAADFNVLAVGFVSAFLVAVLAVKFLLRFIKTHTFIIFGVYRIVIALLFWKLFY
jgi:undecaprenyl-diphosphatase